ncbi:transcriptional regulator, TetR family [Cystobacter fuscus DSM 2262]|uniref:Transcriptional regulator, TetR family n=1 Tax=Cystobacter fuscus (strain ATCC 25194 / DSM 2262 / NBRC 100088 / M29) TaxID=1242864 RepID=S9QF53_CYSF2|nr:TetR/AcrR family transcriptional regulator [Cystobacter fuscus]EPX54983.1 transcriptional regulator, TetR family [Cystobacter fuscus DSM 2262]
MLRERLREETEQTLLEAAEQVFAEQGVLGTRIEDIAKRAGVAVGTLYNYFEDREGLLAALMTRRRTELVKLLDEVSEVSRGKPWLGEFEYFLRATLSHLEQHRRFFAILVQGELGTLPHTGTAEEPGGSGFDDVYACAKRLVQRGVAEGQLKPAFAALYPGLLLGMLRAAIVQERYMDTPAPLLGLVEPFRDFFLTGAGKER